MDLDKIRELIAFAQEHDLVELEVREGDSTIRFRRADGARSTLRQSAQAVAADVSLTPLATREPLTGHVLPAPMAGTFFRAPAPGERPFVELGSHVSAGTVVAIIESMKMMNPVEAGCAGTINRILVANSERVHIDQPLFTII